MSEGHLVWPGRPGNTGKLVCRYCTSDKLRRKSQVRVWSALLVFVSTLGVLHSTTSSALATVEVTVTRAGFATLTSGLVVRNGAWAPVIVEVDLVNQPNFDGSLRIAQFDNDGDKCFDTIGVHLRADAGPSRKLTLYVPANPKRGRGRFFVELLNDGGEAVEVLSRGELTYRAYPAEQPEVISDDDLLILSISDGAVGRVRDLLAAGEQRVYVRQVHVAHMSPLNLSEHWIGLEAVDYIVWDDARPDELTTRQISALLEWARRGGTLLIAAARTAPSLALTEVIDAILPVDLGEIVLVKNLRDVRFKLVDPPRDEKGRPVGNVEWLNSEFRTPVQVARCTIREGASVVAGEGSIDSPVVSRRRLGLGYIIYSSVTLRDLFSAPGGANKFFEKLFGLPRLYNDELGLPEAISLFRTVARVVSFASSGTLYLFVAGVSSIAYVILVTFGTWAFLTARGWRRHSWSALAVVAIAGSVLSVVAVRSKQGFGDTLHQLSIVDAEAGSAFGYATVLFGLKTSTDKELDVWLPGDPLGATDPAETTCFLRPLPSAYDVAEATTSFADPGEYGLIPASAVIDDVRVRATLKQFEGCWSGSLGGRLDGEVFLRRRQITEDSYIINDLGVDLAGCWLLQVDPVIATRRDELRDNGIYAFDIGYLPADARKVPLRSLCYRPTGKQTVTQFMLSSILRERQAEWADPLHRLIDEIGFGSGSGAATTLGAWQKALLLLSTIGDFDATAHTSSALQYLRLTTWSRDRLRRLDMRDRLQTDSAILIGFAADPGPVRLFHRSGNRPYRPLQPDPGRSKTMYRIRIPVTLLGGSQGDLETDDESLLDLENI